MKILLAEDDRAQRVAYAHFFKVWGHEVYEACDGEEALELLRFNPKFHILVSDFHMPRRDGIELILELKERMIILPLIILFSGTLFEIEQISALKLQLDKVQPFRFIHKDEGILSLEPLLNALVETLPDRS